MIEKVFISDLHLHPNQPEIEARFNAFLAWAKNSVKSIYILGDFFHAWAGDDTLTPWSLNIARQLKALADQGISLFYMHGNRDFLLGEAFADLAGWTILTEPTVIFHGKEAVLLVHGDRYCTDDTGHRILRLLTRNPWFPPLFLKLPLKFRERCVSRVRNLSRKSKKTVKQMDVVKSAVLKQMLSYKASLLIHGHTHKPGCTEYLVNNQLLKRFVLSDWDDSPELLCYDYTIGFHYIHL